MDRFIWSDGALTSNEQLVQQQTGLRLYDGDTKSAFDCGKLQLTTFRLIWRHHKEQNCILSLPLSHIILAEEQSSGWYKGPKIVLHLSAAPADRAAGPATSSPNNFIKLSFTDGGESNFFQALQETLSRKLWEKATVLPAAGPRKQLRTGIGGIERNIQKKQQFNDKTIVEAFQDLDKLMERAKGMVALSKNISNKIKDKQGEITDDETIRFKSYLMSMGISDPVTRESHGSGDQYYRELAKQIGSVIQQPLKECGGVMTLTDVYCRVNRARGMELLSPEDLVSACKLLNLLQLPVRMQTFESGVMVLMLASHSDEQAIDSTSQLVQDNGAITAEDLSRHIGLSVILCKERLLSAEKAGKLCRDDTVEGLRFYPNRFLIES